MAREVTLLPRHWDWLNSQPGGASVALRKLVEEARRTHAGKDRVRQSQEAAYRFMSAVAGNLPGFEEATRALFAANAARFDEEVARWPADVPRLTHGKLAAVASFSGPSASVAGLISLGYPFHPVGKPDRLRVEHLQTIKTPTLIVQGERDPFGTREESREFQAVVGRAGRVGRGRRPQLQAAQVVGPDGAAELGGRPGRDCGVPEWTQIIE